MWKKESQRKNLQTRKVRNPLFSLMYQIHCTHYTNHLIACVSAKFWCNVCNGDYIFIAPNGY